MTQHQTTEGSTTVRELDEEVCWSRLAVATVGRIGYVTARGLQIIPVSYRLSGHTLLVNTTPSSAFAQLGKGGRPVTFEVDYHGPDVRLAWSVLMQGYLREPDHATRQRLAALPHPIQSYRGDAATVHLEFVPEHLTGRVLERRWLR